MHRQTLSQTISYSSEGQSSFSETTYSSLNYRIQPLLSLTKRAHELLDLTGFWLFTFPSCETSTSARNKYVNLSPVNLLAVYFIDSYRTLTGQEGSSLPYTTLKEMELN